jgi:hypothetical protein
MRDFRRQSFLNRDQNAEITPRFSPFIKKNRFLDDFSPQLKQTSNSTPIRALRLLASDASTTVNNNKPLFEEQKFARRAICIKSLALNKKTPPGKRR